MKPEELKIPRECFLYPTGSEQIQSEGGEHYEIESVDFTSEIKVYIKDAQFPMENLVMDEILFTTNQAKSVFIEGIRLLTKPLFIIPTVITLIFFRNHLVKPFTWLGHRIMSPIMLKDKHISKFARELQYMVFEFLRHLIDEKDADKVSEIFSRMIDNDDAYKQRLKDIFSMTTKEKLLNPKELTRLLNILDKRQKKDNGSSWVTKVKPIVMLLRIALFFIPSARKGYKSAVKNVNMDNLILHWEDMYWSLYKTDYDFGGMTIQERKELAKQKGWTYPNKMI
jgi:hypothetical protein